MSTTMDRDNILRIADATVLAMRGQMPHSHHEALTALAVVCASMIEEMEQRSPEFPALEFFLRQFRQFVNTDN
jgi:acid phosphatase family membrane protein YuiD